MATFTPYQVLSLSTHEIREQSYKNATLEHASTPARTLVEPPSCPSILARKVPHLPSHQKPNRTNDSHPPKANVAHGLPIANRSNQCPLLDLGTDLARSNPNKRTPSLAHLTPRTAGTHTAPPHPRRQSPAELSELGRGALNPCARIIRAPIPSLALASRGKTHHTYYKFPPRLRSLSHSREGAGR